MEACGGLHPFQCDFSEAKVVKQREKKGPKNTILILKINTLDDSDIFSDIFSQNARKKFKVVDMDRIPTLEESLHEVVFNRYLANIIRLAH